MKADRLLATLLLLQARGGLTARELAAELEVTARTVRRDIDALAAAGVPVYADRGRHGGYRLLGAWRTDATGMTSEEVRALFLFAGGGAATDLGLGEALSSAFRKLAAAVPMGQLPSAAAGAGVLVEGSAWSPDGPPAVLGALREAVETSRRARLAYRAAGAVRATDVVVDPYGLVAKAGRWYLVAGVGDGERLFRADRVASVTILAEPARRPPGSELRAAWERLRDAVPGDAGSIHVVARVARSALATLERLAGRAIEAIEEDAAGVRLGAGRGAGLGGRQAPGAVRRGGASVAAATPDADFAIVRLRYPGVDAARGSLLGFGPAVQVLEPAEVRAEMVAAARAVLDQYETG